MKDQQIVLSFFFRFQEQDDYRVYFAWSYPYPYYKNICYLEELSEAHVKDEEIYFHKEVITYSAGLRLVHLLTISSHDERLETREHHLSDSLFPEREIGTPRAFK
jgi:hypothetical protein